MIAALVLGCLAPRSRAEEAAKKSPEQHLYGALEMTPDHYAANREAGMNVAVVRLSWDRFEPKENSFDGRYIEDLAMEKRKLREMGFLLQLDLGVQYAPGWVFALKGGRYRNQWGEEFRSEDSGVEAPNGVFSAAVRERMAGYFAEVFRRLGANWDFVRLGCGKYGETNYPSARYNGRENCYWGFDELAQGKAPGVADGMAVCPVAGWKPGEASAGHESARRFVEWYLESLKRYQDWQIATVRRDYAGKICLLYGSWGLRPGWLEGAIEGDLAGQTAPERNGEVQQGFDWQRMIGGIRDGKAIVYCTWLDGTIGNRDIADDESRDEARWSPVHWQASLARANALGPSLWGENTGHNTEEVMRLVFKRRKKDELMGVMWAFDGELYREPNPEGLATMREYKELMEKSAKN
ncbi:hypothetical protein BH09VER1_BH09VER1_50990 [soil metagenome]